MERQGTPWTSWQKNATVLTVARKWGNVSPGRDPSETLVAVETFACRWCLTKTEADRRFRSFSRRILKR